MADVAPATVICVKCRVALPAGEAGLCASCHEDVPKLERYWQGVGERLQRTVGASGSWQRARFCVNDGPHKGLRGRELWVQVTTPIARETRDHVTGAKAQEWEYLTHLQNRAGGPVGVASSLVELAGGDDAFARDVAPELVDAWLRRTV